MSRKPFSFSALFLLSLVSAWAQAPAPADAPQNPPAQPAADAPDNKRISISLPKATGNDIAQLYRQLTGKRVLVDSNAVAAEANIVVFGDLNDKEEATRAFEKVLLMNGIAIVPSGVDEVKIINVNSINQNNGNPKAEGVPVITDEADIPDGDNVITFIMPLKSILPDEAKKTFEAIVSKLHQYGSITPVPNASALVITENASLIRKFLQIRESIDVPQQITNKWVNVKYADVETLATTLEKITQPEAQKNATTRRSISSSQIQSVRAAQTSANATPPPGQGGDMTQGGAADTPAQIIPDVRTNRLFLMGRPSELLFLENLIQEFDTPPDMRNILRRKLCYLTVLDFMPVAENALQRLNPDGDKNKNNQNQNRMSQNNRNNGGNTGNSSASGLTDMLKDPQESGAPDSVIIGRTLLVADTITNSIVVQGPPQSIEAINQLLDKIDVRGPQVMISTIFGQFRRTDNREFGLDWVSTLKKSGDFTWAGSDLNSSTGWNPTAEGSDPSKLANLSGLSLYGKFGGNINFLLRAAMDTGRFSVLSRPTIFTVNNRKAVINSGQQVAVVTGTLTGVGTGDNLTQNAQTGYKDVVLQLEVIPLVNSEKEVTLQVGQTNNQITGYQKINGNEMPNLSTQKILTTVTVPNGGTVILGGLITKDTSEQKVGIPILSDIPLLGWAFSSTQKKQEEREIVIFIQPTIIMDNKDGYNSQVQERSRYQVTPEIMDFAEPVSAAAEEGLLPYKDGDPFYTPSEQQYTPVQPSQPVPAAPQTQEQKRKQSSRAPHSVRAFGPF